MTKATFRLRELDVLRGLAIILVLMRHQHLDPFTKTMGWIGVDLFFVLSGFLVSGLLFKEYQKFGNIDPTRFLIRRGFKIYPVYYTFYLLYLIPIIILDKFELKGFLADMFFIQNYVIGFGYAFGASWSLAVEEHFYFGLAFVIWYGLKKKFINLTAHPNEKGLGHIGRSLVMLMFMCLIMRLASNYFLPLQTSRNFTMTHLRIDSLITGVLISYMFYFRPESFRLFYNKYRWLLITMSFLPFTFAPFIDPIQSFFVKTVGFTLLYIGFGSILVIFLMQKNINELLNRFFTKHFINLISSIGFCSYSIYIIHPFVNRVFSRLHMENQFLLFIASSIVSIVFGMLMTYYFEKYFLSLRNKHFPARAVLPIKK